VVASARAIVVENGRVWLAIGGGALAFGAVGAAVIATNGFRFGMDVATVTRSDPGQLRFLLPHSALEFAALTLAASACQCLGWRILELLAFARRPGPILPSLLALAASAGLGVVAAVVEAVSQAARLG
jgi:uncharacterized membrane protein SpoIIM required for sporulation